MRCRDGRPGQHALLLVGDPAANARHALPRFGRCRDQACRRTHDNQEQSSRHGLPSLPTVEL